MPGTSSFSANAFPPIGEGNASEMANELRLQRMYHKRILRLRTIQFWWYPILFVVLGGVIAAALGQFALDLPKVVYGIVIGAPLIFVAVRYPEFG